MRDEKQRRGKSIGELQNYCRMEQPLTKVPGEIVTQLLQGHKTHNPRFLHSPYHTGDSPLKKLSDG